MALNILMFLGLAALSGRPGVAVKEVAKVPTGNKLDKSYYLSEKQREFIRPGLVLTVIEVSVDEDRFVSVTFKITSDDGAPLDRDGFRTPGSVSSSFVLGHIPRDGRQYVSYTNRTVTSNITGLTAVQPTADSGGSIEELEDGVYRYRFSEPLPESYDPDATHSVGMYLARDLEMFELGEPVANAVYHFLPSGGEVTQIREVALTETCNNCHDPLALHGGARREVALCVMCHTDGVIDPDSGNSVDLGEMIHKIHRGHDLPSVQAGTPYRIIGFRNSVHDYSGVAFPQDIRNCEACHPAEAEQNAAHLLEPNRKSCGSCHDDVNFATGQNHVGLPQPSDMFCRDCHFPEGELEFDASIIGAHTIPYQSRQLEGINIDILDVTDTQPGEMPTVSFTMKNDAGDPIEPADLPFFNFILAGPNTDYEMRVSERAVERSVNMGDFYTFTFNTVLPEDATGSYTVGAEAYRNVLLNPGTELEMSHRETVDNPVYYFAVTDPEPVPRRMIVSDEKCESCHQNLELHGSIRHNPSYCVTCHNPLANDGGQRPDEFLPARTIDFKFMVHRIHRGEELSRDFTVFGFGGSMHNYNEVLYPGDLRNCEACHVNDSYQIPSPGVLATETPNEFYSPMLPAATACTGCHDQSDVAAHAYLNTAPFGESCGVCHGEGAEFSVSRMHARP